MIKTCLVALTLLLTLAIGFAQEPEVKQAKPPERVIEPAKTTMQIDEVTALKLQNLQLQMTLLQKNFNEILDEFFKSRQAVPEEWDIDLKQMILIKREKKASVKK